MKTNQPKVFLVLALLIGAILILSCEQHKGDYVNYMPVDISKHKLPPQKAENLSKRYVKDMRILFAQSDSLEYYKELTERLRSELDAKTSNRKLDSKETITFKPRKPKFELSVSDWYSVDELLTYIDKSIETVEASGGKVDGFRIYIGVFPKKGNGEKNNTLTTFITPTGTMGNAKVEGSLLDVSLPLYASSDLTGVDPLEYGSDGDPPAANYPQ